MSEPYEMRRPIASYDDAVDEGIAWGQYHAGDGPKPVFERTPKWKRELRLLRRDGIVKYVRTLRALRRFHRPLKRLP